MAKKEQPQTGIAEQLQPLVDDDAFLTSIAQGQDPSEGGDELAALLLELREDVTAPMPAAPLIEGAENEPTVISLGKARARRRARPFVHGMVGAAAATLLIAGAGVVAANTGMLGSQQQDPAVVELAGTLEEMDKRSAQGDMDGTRELLEEARKILAEYSSATSSEARRQAPEDRATVTETTTVEAPAAEQPSEPAGPVTVTEKETVVSTVVVTHPVAPANPLTPPNTQPQPQEPTGIGEAGAGAGAGGGETGAGTGVNGLGLPGQLPPVQYQN